MSRNPWSHRSAVALAVFTAALLVAAVSMPLAGFGRFVTLLLGPVSLSLFVLVAVVSAPSWERPLPRLEDEPSARVPLPTFGVLLCGGLFLDLALGLNARFAMAHRWFAYVIVMLFAWMTYRIYTRQPFQLRVITITGILASLLSIEALAGVLTARFRLPVTFSALHFLLGSLCLATAVVLTAELFRASRRRVAPRLRLVKRDTKVASAGRVTA